MVFFYLWKPIFSVFIIRGDCLINKSIAVIGAGNMATAIIKGMLSNNVCSAENIYVFDIMPEKTAAFVSLGCKSSQSSRDCAALCETVLLAVKPQNFQEVLSDIKDVCNPEKLFISIAAGISTSYISTQLGFDAKVIRVLPNTPMLYGEGASTICCTHNVDSDDLCFVKGIFDKCGCTEVIDEKLMNASIAIHSSSPAFVFLFAKCIAQTAQTYGIDYDVAVKLFSKTLKGSAKMIEESGLTCDELIKMVASPGGTTLAALNSFNNDDFEGAVARAMKACTDRAFELGK